MGHARVTRLLLSIPFISFIRVNIILLHSAAYRAEVAQLCGHGCGATVERVPWYSQADDA